MSEQKHILFLCGWYPSKVSPNNGDFIQRHAEAVLLNHKVSIIHIISDENSKKKIQYSAEKINGITTHIAYIKSTKNPFNKLFLFLKAFKELLNNVGDFDFVHVNKLFPFGIFALFLKWFKNKEFIVSEHWTGYHEPQSKNISSFEIFLSKIIAKNAKYLSPVSKDLQSSMEKLGLNGNYCIVPNVVDTNLFKPKNKKKEKFTILHASNMLDKHKNVSGIIKTIKKFSAFTQDFQLILVGENSNQYQKLSDELGVSKYIEFKDHVPHQTVVELMQNSDVFVLFSNYENLPCVILESFSCGIPVISTNVGGISEFFPNDFGFLITPNNESELLEKLNHIYQNPNFDKEKLHLYATQNFGKKAIADAFSKLYFN